MKKEELIEIIGHYGIEHQLKKLHEEVYELTEAILLDMDLDHITEEFADVQVLLAQIKAYSELDDSEIKEIFDYKVERQIKRIYEEDPKTVPEKQFKVGDTIKCVDSHECVEMMMSLSKKGVQTDFVYEKNGIKGLWLVVTEVENGG